MQVIRRFFYSQTCPCIPLTRGFFAKIIRYFQIIWQNLRLLPFFFVILQAVNRKRQDEE